MGKKFSKKKNKNEDVAVKKHAYETSTNSENNNNNVNDADGDETTTCLQTVHGDAINSIKINSRINNPDNNNNNNNAFDEIYTCSDDKIAILRKRDKNNNNKISIVRKWTGHKRAVNKIIQGKNHVFTCSRDLTIKQWTKESDDAVGTLEGHTLTISAISEKNDGTLLASGSRDTTVRVWDLATSKEIVRNTTSRNLVTCMQWLPQNSSTIVQGSEDLKLRLWDVRQGNVIKSTQTFSGYVYFPLCMSISDDGNRIMTGSKGFNGVGCEIRIWDLRMNKQCIELTGHQQDVKECYFIRGANNILLTGSKDKTIRLWDIGKYNVEDNTTTNSTNCLLNEYRMYGDGAFTCMDVVNNNNDTNSVNVMYSIADMDGRPNTYVTEISKVKEGL